MLDGQSIHSFTSFEVSLPILSIGILYWYSVEYPLHKAQFHVFVSFFDSVSYNSLSLAFLFSMNRVLPH